MVVVSIVILNWNTANDTIECIKSIFRSGYHDYEIVLVDSNSRPDDFAAIERFSMKHREKIRPFRLERNMGFAGGANFGAGKCRGRYITFLNSDTLAEPGFIQGMLAPFAAGKGVGATCPKMFFYSGGKTKMLFHSGCNSLMVYGASKDRKMGRLDDGKFESGREEGMFSGTCFMIPRAVFEELGGFCGFYFAYFEDGDLSWRLRSSGRKILYTPSSVIYHKCSLSVIVNRKQSMQAVLGVRNKYLTYYRNLRFRDFMVLLPLMAAFDTLKCFKDLTWTRGRSVADLAKGFTKFLLSVNKVDKPRKGRLSDLEW